MRHVRSLATTSRSIAQRSLGRVPPRGRGRGATRPAARAGAGPDSARATKNPLRPSAARIRELDQQDREESEEVDTELPLNPLEIVASPPTPPPVPEPSRTRARVRARAPRSEARTRPAPAPVAKPLKGVLVGRHGLSAEHLAALSGARPGAVVRAAKALGLKTDAPLGADDLELLVEEARLEVRIERAGLLFGKTPMGDRPVVAVMGHVDHGKTSLLDKLRGGNTAAGEAGGITQAIGAFEAGDITFIDTPGHAAFAAMRARGATATDVVVLVVAADDGVMPQTLEAIKHARAARVPVVVAINKMDVLGADADRVRAQLLQNDINTEQTGGDVLCVEVSAKTGHGLDELLEAIQLQAEVCEQSESSGTQAGADMGTRLVTIESNRDRVLGGIATMVVRAGTLKVGDFVLFQDNDARTGDLYGRVRSLIDVNGRNVKQAGPGRAVGVVGIGHQIPPGSIAIVVPDEKHAKRRSRDIIARNVQVFNTLQEAQRLIDERNAKYAPEDEDDEQSEQQSHKGTLNVVIKGDVQGSADAAANCIRHLATSDYRVRVLVTAAGSVTSADLTIASATAKLKRKTDDALIVAFGVKAPQSIVRDAKRQNVAVIQHQLIYHLEDDVRERIENARAKWTTIEKSLGTADVVRVFEDGAVGGCSVTDGSIVAGAEAKVWRYPADESQPVCVHQGTLVSLKHFAKDVPSASKGTDCGVGFQDWSDFRTGDRLQCVKLIKGANVA